MNGAMSSREIVSNPYVAFAIWFAMLFVLPGYGAVGIMFASASVITFYIAAVPESFRDRSGSMRTAHGLVAFMWALAALAGAMTFAGAIR